MPARILRAISFLQSCVATATRMTIAVFGLCGPAFFRANPTRFGRAVEWMRVSFAPRGDRVGPRDVPRGHGAAWTAADGTGGVKFALDAIACARSAMADAATGQSTDGGRRGRFEHGKERRRRLRGVARRGREGAARPAGRQPDMAHARGHSGQAAVYGGRHPGPPACRHAARVPAVRPRPAADDVRAAAVDDPPVRRLLHRRGIECVLPAQPRRRRPGRVGGLRPGHPSRLRLRPSARGRRRRESGRGDRLGRGHEDPVRRHPARPGVGVDDDERRACCRCSPATSSPPRSRACGRTSSPGPSRTTSSRSSWSATPTSTRRRRRCGSSATSSGTRRSTCRSSTRSRSPATTCRRRARRRRWSWR